MKALYFFLVSYLSVQTGHSQVFYSIRPPLNLNSVEMHNKEMAKAIIDSTKVQSVDTFKTVTEEEMPIYTALTASLPLSNLHITSPFGFRNHPLSGKYKFHKGVDLSARSDTVQCILPGIVTEAGNDQALGNYVRVTHGNYESLYGHLSTRFVKKDDRLIAGNPIGITGKTGKTTGEHLHFAIYKSKIPISPIAFLTTIRILKATNLFNLLVNNSEKND